MKFILFLSSILSICTVFGQTKNLHLTNAIVVGQMEKAEDRYTLEINLAELFVNNGIKANPSLNILKSGNELALLANDSLTAIVKNKGYDTYALISVRGYDNSFKKTSHKDPLVTALSAGNLFPIYRDEIASVTFEIMFYRNGQFIGSDLIKCGNVSTRDGVLKKFRKNITKKIQKNWK
jgi:hypothetical protein